MSRSRHRWLDPSRPAQPFGFAHGPESVEGRDKGAVRFAMVLLLAAWAASAAVQVAIDRQMAPYRETPEMLWIPSGKLLRTLSLGQNGLLGNIYWTRAVQYYGSLLRDRKTDFSLLAPLLDITVTLDPQLIVAYYFGAFFLSAPPPRGAGQPEKAIELLQRGIQSNPDAWRLWHHLGFLYYWELHDYPNAAAAYQEGSKHPKAGEFMKVMAALILQKGGNRETSRFLWTEIYHSSEDPTIRRNAFLHLQGLRALDDIAELERRARLFREQTGRWPETFQEMVDRGILSGIPLDPNGLDYQLHPEGKVTLHPSSNIQLDSGPSPPVP